MPVLGAWDAQVWWQCGLVRAYFWSLAEESIQMWRCRGSDWCGSRNRGYGLAPTCLALCEVIKGSDTNTTSASHGIMVVPAEECVATRYFFFYNGKAPTCGNLTANDLMQAYLARQEKASPAPTSPLSQSKRQKPNPQLSLGHKFGVVSRPF